MADSKKVPETKKSYTEIDHIREDLDSLKNNVFELTRHMKKDGSAQVMHVRDALKGKMDDLQSTGREQFKNLERQVKAKPGQTLAMAFAAGLVASMFLGRRR